MFRHVIAPSGGFTQISNEIIRHPRLSLAAKSLLCWQLSLPSAAKETFSQTAKKAGIGRVALHRARLQLIAEGYLYEVRRQDAGGCWRTRQVVSSVPLTTQEAEALLNGSSSHGTSPTAGRCGGRYVGGQTPSKTSKKNTHPRPPSAHPRPPSVPAALAGEAQQLLLSLRESEPRLAMSRRKAAKWAPLAAAWLARGCTHDQIRETLTTGLDTARSAKSVLDWRLKNAVPEPAEPPVPKAPPRVPYMRECAGGAHIQPLMFSPQANETHCPTCTADRPPSPPPSIQGPGFRAFLAARGKPVPEELRRRTRRPATPETGRDDARPKLSSGLAQWPCMKPTET